MEEVLNLFCMLADADMALVSVHGDGVNELIGSLGMPNLDLNPTVKWVQQQPASAGPVFIATDISQAGLVVPPNIKSAIGFRIPYGTGEWQIRVVAFCRHLVTVSDSDKQRYTSLVNHAHRLILLQNSYHNLKHSRDYYKNIIETAGDVIFEANAQGEFTYVNQRMCEVTGFQTGELLNMNILDILVDEDRDRVMDHLVYQIANLVNDSNIEFRIKKGDGTNIWVDQNIRLFFGEDSMLVKATGVARDITEERKRKRELMFTSHAVNTAPVGLAWLRKDATYVTHNQLYCQLTGRDTEVLKERKVYELDPEFDKDDWVQHWEDVHREKSLILNRTLEGLDGVKRHLELRLNAINFENEELIQAICIDITERKRLEQNLITEKDQFRKTFEHASNGMALVGMDGRWIRVNERVCDIVGYTSEELLGRKFQSITLEEDLEKDLELMNELVNGKRERYTLEKRYYHKSGKPVWVQLAVSLVRDDEGNPLHFVSQIQDISRSKMLSDMTEDQNKRLLNFAHIVSHNLRSHATNISMLLSLIGKEEPEAQANEMFPMIVSASDKLRETIDHLNEVVAMNQKTLENLELLDLNGFIEDARMNIQAMAIQSNLKFINEVEKGTNVRAIPAYMDSVLLNFLTNAIKYKSPERDPVIKFSSYRFQSYVVLVIEDNGLGIDLERHGDKLFGMYKTFHGSEDAKGIGLFITKNQVETMGGHIEVESQVDVGTTFKVYLKHEEEN